MRYKIILLAIWIGGLQACMPSETYIKTYFMPTYGWAYNDIKPFTFEISDTSKKYDLIFLMQHDYAYKYSNVIVQLITKYPKGNIDSTTPLEIPLSPPDGHWLATTGANKANHEINIGPEGAPLQFKEKGIYTISMHQMMRDSLLSGIEKIGLSLKVHQSKK